jgi:predicted RNase H-like HicB family nuclease
MITFKIERDGEEFHTWAPELPGCHSHGKTVAEAMENLKDAVRLYLDVLMEEEIAQQTVDFV